MKTPNYKIRHFRDYHEIQSKTYKTLELGCFPTKGYGYFRYYGLFWKGRVPSIDKILQSLNKKVMFGTFVFTKDNLKQEIKTALKFQNNNLCPSWDYN